MGREAVEVASVGFRSHDGQSRINGMVWKPTAPAAAAKPKAIIQLVHGMSEHIARYDDFARFLASQGFVVCGHDHIGHGKSVKSPDDLGCLPVKGGKDVLIQDVHELRKTVTSRYSRQTPYIIFGHSMGSFVAYAYLARHGQGVSGAVICGTGRQPVALSKAGGLLARFLAATKGPRYKSTMLHNMGVGAYGKQVEGAQTDLDWLSTDRAVVDAYAADGLCGAMFSVGGYATLLDLTYEIATPACARKVPADVPVLFVAGNEDPVGECGAGVDRAAAMLRDAGAQHVEVKLYPGMRHEILNEPGKAEVYDDVLAWMLAALEARA